MHFTTELKTSTVYDIAIWCNVRIQYTHYCKPCTEQIWLKDEMIPVYSRCVMLQKHIERMSRDPVSPKDKASKQEFKQLNEELMTVKIREANSLSDLKESKQKVMEFETQVKFCSCYWEFPVTRLLGNMYAPTAEPCEYIGLPMSVCLQDPNSFIYDDSKQFLDRFGPNIHHSLTYNYEVWFNFGDQKSKMNVTGPHIDWLLS